jgi:hypothetical protein
MVLEVAALLIKPPLARLSVRVAAEPRSTVARSVTLRPRSVVVPALVSVNAVAGELRVEKNDLRSVVHVHSVAAGVIVAEGAHAVGEVLGKIAAYRRPAAEKTIGWPVMKMCGTGGRAERASGRAEVNARAGSNGAERAER